MAHINNSRREYVITADRLMERQMPAQLEAILRSQPPTCARCAQPIPYPAMRAEVRGIQTLHPSCAIAHDRAERHTRQRQVVAEAPTLAYLSGRALPFDERCAIFAADGTSHMERFTSDAFNIEYPHDIRLRINHDEHGDIPADLTFAVTREGLDFVARVPDTPRAQQLLRISSRLQGVSIECTHLQTRPETGAWAGRGIVIERAKLLAISLTIGQDRRPQWFGTSCRITRVS